jgi:hypothetical protein
MTSFRATTCTARFLALAVPSWARLRPQLRSTLLGSQHVAGTAYQKTTKIAVSAFPETQLLVRLFVLISPETQTHKGSNVSGALEAFRVLDLEHEVKRRGWS